MICPDVLDGYVSDEDSVNPQSRKRRGVGTNGSAKAPRVDVRPNAETLNKYERGPGNTWKDSSQKLRLALQSAEKKARTAVRRMARAELMRTEPEAGFLEATEPGEKTYTLRQEQLLSDVDVQTMRKRYDLHLPVLGPYVFSYSPNGNALALLGEKGHAATMLWKKAALQTELQLKERCSDITFFHDDRLFAVAQRKYTYIYSTEDGSEVHQLRCMADTLRLEFLPQHFLLCGAGRSGLLSWMDVSTGKVAGTQRTRMGEPQALRRDPSTNVLAVSHTNGTVTFWSPSVARPLVRLAAHRGPALDVAFDVSGNYLASVGRDNRTRVWDLRTMMPLHHLPTLHGTCVDFSYTGLLAVGLGHRVEVWKDLILGKQASMHVVTRKPYMAHNHDAHTTLNYRARFCPYEDVLGVSHSLGFSSLLIPGAGCSTPDFFASDIFETRRSKAERPVQMLLDKLSADTIRWEGKFKTSDLKEIGAMTSRKKKRDARSRRQAAKDRDNSASRGERSDGGESDDSSDMDTNEEKDIEKVWAKQKESEEKDSTRLRDKIREKRERRLRRLEETKRFQVLQRRKGRQVARLTRRRVRKQKEGTSEVGPAGGDAAHPAKTHGTNLALARFKN